MMGPGDLGPLVYKMRDNVEWYQELTRCPYKPNRQKQKSESRRYMHIAGIKTLKDQTQSPNQCYLTNNRD